MGGSLLSSSVGCVEISTQAFVCTPINTLWEQLNPTQVINKAPCTVQIQPSHPISNCLRLMCFFSNWKPVKTEELALASAAENSDSKPGPPKCEESYSFVRQLRRREEEALSLSRYFTLLKAKSSCFIFSLCGSVPCRRNLNFIILKPDWKVQDLGGKGWKTRGYHPVSRRQERRRGKVGRC